MLVDSTLEALMAVAHDPIAYAALVARSDFNEAERFHFGTPDRLRYLLELPEPELAPGERVLGPDDFD